MLFSADALCPFVIWSIVKTEAKAPDNHVTNGLTSYIKVGEIQSLAEKNEKAMIDANAMMKAYHEIVDNLDLGSHDRALIVDRADILMVKLIFNKDVPQKIKSIQQVAGEACKSMIDKHPDQLSLLQNPWEEFVGGDPQPGPSAGSSASQPSVAGSGLIEYSTDGAASNAYRMTVVEQGFKIGSTVHHTVNSTRLYKIIDMGDASVKLREVDTSTGQFVDKQLTVIEYGKFLNRYAMKKEIEMLEKWPFCTIVGSETFRSSVVAAHCMIFLNELVEEHKEPTVTIRVKPSKAVFASTIHKAKALTMIPVCSSITDISETSDPIVFFMKAGKFTFAMKRPTKVESAAFYVRSSNDPEECNCSIKKVKSESGSYPTIIECTVIYNTKKLAVGEELVLHREKAAKVENNRSPVVKLTSATFLPNFKKPRIQ